MVAEGLFPRDVRLLLMHSGADMLRRSLLIESASGHPAHVRVKAPLRCGASARSRNGLLDLVEEQPRASHAASIGEYNAAQIHMPLNCSRIAERAGPHPKDETILSNQLALRTYQSARARKQLCHSYTDSRWEGEESIEMTATSCCGPLC